MRHIALILRCGAKRSLEGQGRLPRALDDPSRLAFGEHLRMRV